MGYDEHTTVKIATLYYLKDLGQEEIAVKLGLSRQSVGRHLKYAREKGIVEFSIRSPESTCSELELRLETAYGLSEAVVVKVPVSSDEVMKNEIGKAAAAFLERRVRSGDILGVSWSSTVLACARELEATGLEGVRIVQINGSMDRADYSTRAEYIMEKMAGAFSASSYALAAPLLVDSAKIRDALLADSRIQATFELARKADIAVFGIGSISRESSLYKTGYMDENILTELRSRGAVGDVCGHFFDARGDICDPDLDACLLAVSREEFRRKKLAIGLAGGPEKTTAIRAALLGGWCNVLVTDEDTARALTETEEKA